MISRKERLKAESGLRRLSDGIVKQVPVREGAVYEAWR
jgi:hypothetical protein